MREVTCQKCGHKFDAISQRTHSGICQDINKIIQSGRSTPEALIDQSAEVKCPECGYVFTSEAIRYFGIIRPKALKYIIGLFVFWFLVFVIYEIFNSFRI